jgi:hypothetical protein
VQVRDPRTASIKNWIAYASSKAAVRNHRKSVALWCAQQGLAIRCNSRLGTDRIALLYTPRFLRSPRNSRTYGI